ncbi:endomembrane protein 70, putative [Trichomonas vaginalis G3]|uniref:Transmembrane 9 superfamily member n=1 Tax=Trichomonas vaginalis (strain ATCC PRA-98 / G3) TaxID=412133 RepID=A2E9J6_TRIV3|nr:positive regulation of protein exit from endoplasmic reticulum [Trichomonas vaginalis G3]EAY10647.1 endomembrane protein 70, putative [Trichomonas vaginalis G3]KAI5512214.1 positive regulation of protein exit from endoplasmic reticulum [Trichomonas vaginalis G3]|eukprot:XP_001322870.1 endomembrane protein 70 [Trichomonas vaginalis G3]
MLSQIVQTMRMITILPPKAKLYSENEKLSIYAGTIKSSLIAYPYDYNYLDLLCQADNKTEPSRLFNTKLLEIGEKKTPYELEIGKDIENIPVCNKTYTDAQKKALINLIDNKYRLFYKLDKLLIRDEFQTNESITYLAGAPLGIKDSNNKHYLYNHFDFNVELSPLDNGKTKIVGFETGIILSSEGSESIENMTSVNFTYSVHFFTTKTQYENRWAKLTSGFTSNMHWLSALSTLVIIIAQAVVMGALLLRNVKFDFKRYRKMLDDEDDPLEESGWKLVHGDVFRRPIDIERLTEYLSGGLSLLFAVGLLLFLLALGIFDYIKEISLMKAFVYCFIISNLFSGIISGAFFHTIGTKAWKNTMFRSSIVAILPVFVIHGVINMIQLDSSITMHLIPYILLYAFYGGISALLFIIGFVYGLRMRQYEFPSRVNQLPRQIPYQPKYLNGYLVMYIGSLVTFLSFAFQAHTLMDSIWISHSPYRLYLLLFIIFLAMVATACEVSILVVYLYLAHENYNWWWISFYTAAYSGAYYFVYSIIYLFTFYKPATKIAVISFLLVSLLIGIIIFLINGASGFLSSLIFVTMLFKELKME